MKKFCKYPILLATAGAATVCLSWNQLAHTNTTLHSAKNTEWKSDAFFSSLDKNDLAALEAEDYWDNYYEAGRSAPPAEDVLVQRIPGDNGHLLMMAYYSKEHFSGQSVTINSGGSQLVFRDDGKGDDKIAGDGLFTAKVAVNVNEFRQRAIRMNEEMKNSGYKPIRFVNRSMIIDPDKTEGFDAAALDGNRTVSISGLEGGTGPNARLLDSIKENSIFLTHLKVVEDVKRTWNPCTQTGDVDGAWTFKTLMKQLASKDPQHLATNAEVSDFVKSWLSSWRFDKTINEDLVPARPLIDDKILKPWLDKSKANGSPDGQLDMKFAPFKLTAILNRFDLREIFKGIPAGEARFIFCLIDNSCTVAENFTVIIEYGINKPDVCDSLMAWAQQWFNLKNFKLGSEQYNKALEKITDQFTLSGTNPRRTNQSSLNTIRTNDRVLSPEPQKNEYREFVLGTGGRLVETTVTDAAADRYNAQVDNPDIRRVVKWVNDNAQAIVDSQLRVPQTFEDSPLLGGKSTILGKPVGNPEEKDVYHWDGTKEKGPAHIQSHTARHNFSLNACSGCHAGETQTNLNHVTPEFFGTKAKLSGFLTGKGRAGAYDFDGNPDNDSLMVEDPALRPLGDPRLFMFNDILRRARDLKTFVEDSCGDILQIRDQLMFKPVGMVH